MSGKFATRTKVPAEKSRSELERLISKYDAKGFAYGAQGGRVMVGFEMVGRRVRFVMTTSDDRDERGAQMRRQKWRALLLTIKAKLESVCSGIEEFDDAFMAQIVLPDGQTMGERSKPLIQQAYESGRVPPLLEKF